MKTKIVIVVIFALLIGTITFIAIDKPDIHEATIEELIEIDGIGEVLASRVISYLEVNKNATIDDIEDVRGIGAIKLRKIRGKYD